MSERNWGELAALKPGDRFCAAYVGISGETLRHCTDLALENSEFCKVHQPLKEVKSPYATGAPWEPKPGEVPVMTVTSGGGAMLAALGEPRRCPARNRDGGHCILIPLEGETFCWVHKPECSHAADEFEEESILDEAARITSKDRRQKYGHPLDNFGQIAELLTGYFRPKLKDGEVIEAADIPWVNILTKAARDSHFRMRDNYTDTAGYARTGQVVQEEIRRRAGADLTRLADDGNSHG